MNQIQVRRCDACGESHGVMTWTGRALLCRLCHVDVLAEIDRRREAGARGSATSTLSVAREMLRAKGTRDIIIRDVPDNMLTEIEQHGSIRDVVIVALANWLALLSKEKEMVE